ncbi:DUF5133 domain-containing protein [Streptomyces abyssomicinicus]|uniref:DUF5133 domain-containing protein n=1 Tax=Streptomyces abyssomicinicus TaxID=574929 RepID=UPI00124F975D
MLTPHPATLRKLVDEYHALLAEEAERGGPRTGRRSEDLAYTLCVSTGTRDVRAALAAARRMLAGPGPGPAAGGLPAGAVPKAGLPASAQLPASALPASGLPSSGLPASGMPQSGAGRVAAGRIRGGGRRLVAEGGEPVAS